MGGSPPGRGAGSPGPAAAAALKVLCPEMYDGNGGVAQSGVQAGSAVTSGLTPPSPARIAVTGRQVSYVYLAPQAAIPASARAMSSRANSRAEPSRPVRCATAAIAAI